MKNPGLWTNQRETLLTIGPLMRTQAVTAWREAVGWLKGMKLSARDFENSEPQFTMRGIAGQCKLQVVLWPPDLKLTTEAEGVQFSYGESMRTFLIGLGVLASLCALLAFGTVFTKGTDIQLIAAGVFGTMAAVSFGFAATLAKMELPRKETATDLARELLGKWEAMEPSARDRLARSLIQKIDTSTDPSELKGAELKDRLSSLIAAKA